MNVRKGKVIAQLPSAGLGNILLVWAKAFIFAKTNNLPLYVIGWRRIHLGPLIRGEKRKRYYGLYFKKTHSIFFGFQLRLELLLNLKNCVVEPPVNAAPENGTTYIFNAVPHWVDYFKGIRDYRELVKNELFGMLRPPLKICLEKSPTPQIGMHIRLGDFRKLNEGEDFSKLGSVRTPEAYFDSVIHKLRQQEPGEVTIFSDGKLEELSHFLSLEGVRLANENPDIVDILLLSRSKVIVTSAGSTFSYWAAFLSDSPVIYHPAHLPPKIRNGNIFEGPVEDYVSSKFGATSGKAFS